MFRNVPLHMALISTEDAESLHHLMVSNKAYFNRYLPKTVAANLTLEKSKVFIQKISEEIKTNKQFLYTLKLSNQVVGLVYLKNLDWNIKQGELAYGLAQRYTKNGFMSQSVKKIITIAFEKLELESLIIITHKTNIGSIRVARKCGFLHNTTLKNKFTPPGEQPLDMELYELRK